MTTHRDSGGRALPVALLLCAIVALLPARFTRWSAWVADPVVFIVQPIADPITRITGWLRPSTHAAVVDSPAMQEIQRLFDEQSLALRQAELRVQQLERQVRDLQAGVPVAPEARVRQLWAPVTSRSSNLGDGTIRIGVGETSNVEPKVSIATARGVHLVGRVVDVRTRTSWVLPFNHPSAGHIEGVVLTGSTLEQSFGCQLLGRSDGLLAGDLVAEAVGIEPGQIVRLRDETWPAAAQMLILGRVTEVDTKENGRIVIIVEPQIPPGRVSEVVLRIPESQEAPS
jgi:cell shape-determining protein MreC